VRRRPWVRVAVYAQAGVEERVGVTVRSFPGNLVEAKTAPKTGASETRSADTTKGSEGKGVSHLGRVQVTANKIRKSRGDGCTVGTIDYVAETGAVL